MVSASLSLGLIALAALHRRCFSACRKASRADAIVLALQPRRRVVVAQQPLPDSDVTKCLHGEEAGVRDEAVAVG